jgi:hypothetical protein
MWAGFICIMTGTNDRILVHPVNGYYSNTFPRSDFIFMFLINSNINAEPSMFGPDIHIILNVLNSTPMVLTEDRPTD